MKSLKSFASLALYLLLLTATGVLASGDPSSLPGLEARYVQDDVFGGEILVQEGGDADGPPVVLVHGIGREASGGWAELVEELTKDFRVLAFDLPGFGRSSGGNLLYSPDRYARVLWNLVDDFSDEPVHLVGHSLGGAIALRYAGRHPGRVERLYLADVSGILHKASYTGFLTSPGTSDIDGFLDRIRDRLVRKMMRKVPVSDDILASSELRDRFLGGNPETIAALALAETDFGRTLSRITMPVSVFWGTEDRLAPLRTGRLLAATLPGRDLVLFEGVGHSPMLESPAEFNASLLERMNGGLPDTTTWPPPAETPGDRTAECIDDAGVTLQGRFDVIRIRNCSNIVLDRVTARYVDIERSRVVIHEPRIIGDERGLRVSGSEVEITGGEIAGETAIEITRTYLDVAGTRLEGRETAIRGVGSSASEVILSVSSVTSGGRTRILHDLRALGPGESL